MTALHCLHSNSLQCRQQISVAFISNGFVLAPAGVSAGSSRSDRSAADLAGEPRMLLRAPQALTLSCLDVLLSGGSSPSVSLSLRHGPDASAAGTAVTTTPTTISSAKGGTTTGTVVTSFQTPVVPTDHWLWLEVTAVSGSPAGLTVSVRFS